MDKYWGLRVLLGVIGVAIVIGFGNKHNVQVVFNIISISFIVKIIGWMYASAEVIRNIITRPNGHRINILERSSVFFLSGFFFLMQKWGVWEKILLYIDLSTRNNWNLAIRAFFVAFLFLHQVFFSCVQLIIPTIFLLEYIEKIVNFLSFKFHKIYNKVMQYEEELFISKKVFLLRPIENIKCAKNGKKWNLVKGVITFPFALILDILWSTANLVFSITLVSICCYILIILRMLKNTFLNISKWFCAKSDLVIIAWLFRFSIIITCIYIVMFNRLDNTFSFNDSYTAVLEFIANAIIIPVIYDGISSVKQNK